MIEYFHLSRYCIHEYNTSILVYKTISPKIIWQFLSLASKSDENLVKYFIEYFQIFSDFIGKTAFDRIPVRKIPTETIDKTGKILYNI